MTTAYMGHPSHICNIRGVYRPFHFPEKFWNRNGKPKGFGRKEERTSPMGVKCGFCFPKNFKVQKGISGNIGREGVCC